MSTTAVDTRSSVQDVLAWAVATAAAAGGLIHLEASIDHRDLTIVAMGFAAMGMSQWVVAGMILIRPSSTMLLWGGILHGAIALVWILSRTIGLPFIPGAEQAAQVGVADVVANTFSIAVVGATIIGHPLVRSHETVPLPPGAARSMKAVALVGALILTVAALNEAHDHAHHTDATTPTTSHSHDHRPPP